MVEVVNVHDGAVYCCALCLCTVVAVAMEGVTGGRFVVHTAVCKTCGACNRWPTCYTHCCTHDMWRV